MFMGELETLRTRARFSLLLATALLVVKLGTLLISGVLTFTARFKTFSPRVGKPGVSVHTTCKLAVVALVVRAPGRTALAAWAVQAVLGLPCRLALGSTVAGVPLLPSASTAKGALA